MEHDLVLDYRSIPIFLPASPGSGPDAYCSGIFDQTRLNAFARFPNGEAGSFNDGPPVVALVMTSGGGE